MNPGKAFLYSPEHRQFVYSDPDKRHCCVNDCQTFDVFLKQESWWESKYPNWTEDCIVIVPGSLL